MSLPGLGVVMPRAGAGCPAGRNGAGGDQARSVFHRSLGLSSICDGSGASPAVLLVETVVVRVVVGEREAVVASLALLVANSFFLRQL